MANDTEVTLMSRVKRRFEAESDATCTSSIEELVASAFVLCGALTLVEDQIENCILDKHPYFRRLWASGTGASDPAIKQFSEDLNNYIHEFNDFFTITQYSDRQGVASVTTSNGSLFSLLKDFSDCRAPSVSVSPNQSEWSGHLPPEIWLKIYRYLCAFPGYRLSFECGDPNACMVYDDDSTAIGWLGEQGAWSYFSAAANEKIMAARLCSRAFNSGMLEAYYSRNTFQFTNVGVLNYHMKRMGSEGRRNLKKITVKYHHLKEAPEVAAMLPQCIALKIVVLVVNINHKSNGKLEVLDDKLHGRYTYSEVSDIPGMEEFKSTLSSRAGVLKIAPCTNGQDVPEFVMYLR